MEDAMEYGKKSMGQWFVIYAVVALVVYGAYYYYAMGNKSTTGYGSGTEQSPTPVAMESTKVMSEYLTDADGMTLYTFDKDTSGVSSCYGDCAASWPPYLVGESVIDGLTTITRKDGSKQYAKDGMPLYYYIKDVKAGDTMGDGVNDTWHLAK